MDNFDEGRRVTGIIQVLNYFVIFGVNVVVFYLSGRLFPDNVVIGTATISTVEGLVLASGALALIDTFMLPFAREYERIKQRMLAPKDWLILYLFINFAGVWLVTRFAHLLGVGISAWYVALALAAVLDVIQSLAGIGIEKLRDRSV